MPGGISQDLTPSVFMPGGISQDLTPSVLTPSVSSVLKLVILGSLRALTSGLKRRAPLMTLRVSTTPVARAPS